MVWGASVNSLALILKKINLFLPCKLIFWKSTKVGSPPNFPKLIFQLRGIAQPQYFIALLLDPHWTYVWRHYIYYKKDTKVGSQNFGYQIWFCTRLLIPKSPTGDLSTLVQVMAQCRQANSHYLNQFWFRSVLPLGITRPQCFKLFLCVLWNTRSILYQACWCPGYWCTRSSAALILTVKWEWSCRNIQWGFSVNEWIVLNSLRTSVGYLRQ